MSAVTGAPAVSVILTSFNQAPYLREAVDSVLGQTFADWELIVVDNGSTDGSHELLREYEGHPRVRLMLFDENGPITRRFNSGVQAARGEFVSFLFSDDYYLPEKLERQVAAFRSLPEDYGVVYGPPLRLNDLTGAQWQSPSIRASGDVFRSLMLDHYDGPVEMIPAMIRREALLRHPFHEDLFTEGENVFFRIALTHRFAFVDEPLSVMRDHATNMGKALVPNVAHIRRALVKLRTDAAMTPEKLRLVDDFEGNLLRSSGWQAARLNVDPAWARACFGSAMRLSPRHAAHPKTWAGAALTLLPARLRRAVNDIGHTIRNDPGNARLRDDYERPGA
ncbi:MAG: hypothetical protein QOD44_680 [Solirubrobacteraceae bacterium]|nr:hypothetical protein [Solirubrobacteraceae bacterium]